ncbi:ABC transporter permease [uncultured Brevundimonas sp.]|uniref:ABC transporter permease n=1 Tax=uncultured Brevundimonas sp. TaxID=213418 RepID=UPI002627FFE3|nr:ABC transporter permease [uncultured Brevundimonas sp.]
MSLKLQGRRSLLALLGVMIGSASIVALLSFSHIARAEVMRRFEALGADTVQLVSDPTGQQWMDHRLFSRQFSEEQDIRVAVPLSVTRDSVGANGQAESASIVATTQDGFEWLSPGMAAGRGLASGDGCNGAAVLGSALAKTLGAGVGDVVFIGGYGYRAVGLLAPADPMGVLPVSPDEAVLIGLG